jgi:signal transduction histidine kinase
MEHNAVLVNDAAGNPAGLATMSYDISGRRDAQLALEAANAELERKVASRTEELQAALDRALAADRLKSEFVAHMSHELRTPLNAILGFTGTLLLRLPGPLNSDQIRQLETIQSSARHLLALINDLLDVSKIESGKTEAYLEPVACQAVVMDVVNALSDEAVRKGLVLDTALPDEPVVVRSDRRLLRQIVLNLLGNAIKFTDTGSVRVSVSRGDVRLGETACIVVADTGIGIPPDRQNRLFERFARVHSSEEAAREGTGLGLYLSQRLAELLDGHITFRSEPGQGSVFALTLKAPVA